MEMSVPIREYKQDIRIQAPYSAIHRYYYTSRVNCIKYGNILTKRSLQISYEYYGGSWIDLFHFISGTDLGTGLVRAKTHFEIKSILQMTLILLQRM